MTASRCLVVTVCLREGGFVTLAVERGRRPRRLDAAAVLRSLQQIAERRGLTDRVRFREACAGGCATAGPNVAVTVHPMPAPGERVDHVAVAWRTYVYSLRTLDCLARIIEENLEAPSASPRTPPGRSAPRSRRPAC